MDHYFLRLFPRFVCFSVKKLCQSNDWVGSRGVLGIKPEQNCGGGGGSVVRANIFMKSYIGEGLIGQHVHCIFICDLAQKFILYRFTI